MAKSLKLMRILIWHLLAEEKVETTPNGEDDISKSSPKPQDFMNELMKFMSAKMKWQKEDREKEK